MNYKKYIAIAMLSVASLLPADRLEDPTDAFATEGYVWGGIILISNSTTDTEASRKKLELPPSYAENLSNIFPDYSNQTLLGSDERELYREYDTWLVPSKSFFFKLEYRGREELDAGNRVAMQLWHEKRILVKADVVLGVRSPMIIKGPTIDDGVVLLVVEQTK